MFFFIIRKLKDQMVGTKWRTCSGSIKDRQSEQCRRESLLMGKLLRLTFKVLSLKDTPRLPNSNGQ